MGESRHDHPVALAGNAQPPGRGQWGYFRRPAFLGPAVGFLAFVGSEAIRSPRTGSAEGLIWLVPTLVAATVIAAIPYLIGALLLLALFRVLPAGWVRPAAVRLFIGALVGALIAWPMAFALNGIPSATTEPRFNIISLLVACGVAGSFCAGFFSPSSSE